MPTPESLLASRKVSQKMGGDFAPVVKFTKPEQRLVGVYQGRGQFKTPDGKMASSHNFKLIALSEGVEIIRSKEKIAGEEGMLVSTSGFVLDSNLTDALIGKTIAILYVGDRKTARNGSAVKVFELEVYDAEAVAA
jgi:hypothetical protein